MEKQTFDRFSKSLFQNQPGFGTSSVEQDFRNVFMIPETSGLRGVPCSAFRHTWRKVIIKKGKKLFLTFWPYEAAFVAILKFCQPE
jgi:hypothetical protein